MKTLRLAMVVAITACGSGSIQLTPPADGGGVTFDLTIPPGAVGSMCVKNTDCTSMLCLGNAGTGVCTGMCGGSADCPKGWMCGPLMGVTGQVCQCTPSREICDGVDNDCNGAIDDGMACGPFGTCSSAKCVQCSPTGNNTAKFVINQLTMPMSRNELALDLNGDAKVDNQFGNVVGAFTGAAGVNPGADAQAAVDAGQALMLIAATSADATFTTDACAAVLFEDAQPHAAPDFTGNGMFTVDGSVPPGKLVGGYASAKYASDPPATTMFPVTITVELALFGPTPIKLPLVGAHIQYQQSASGLMNGQINGAIKQSDVQTVLIPGMAANMNQKIAANPNATSSKQLLQIFDTDKNGTISADELGQNAIIKNVLNPDVQMFNGTTYQPNPANTMKDSFSIGFGFTTVKASF